MPGRLGPRFALEAAFLLLLAVAMGLAELGATAIIVVMAVAWLLVAAVEWFASRDAVRPSVPRAWAPPAAELWRDRDPVGEDAVDEEEEADTDAKGLAVAEPAASGGRRLWRRGPKSPDGEEKSRSDR